MCNFVSLKHPITRRFRLELGFRVCRMVFHFSRMNRFGFHPRVLAGVPFVFFLLVAALPLAAQAPAGTTDQTKPQTPAAAQTQDEDIVNRYDVFAGYSYLRLDTKSYGFQSGSNLQGGNLAGAFNITHEFSVAADISGYWANNQHYYNFMAGPQYAVRKFDGRFFAQLLFGKARNANEEPYVVSSLGRSIAIGGGYDHDFRSRYSIRVFQVDYVNSHSYGATQNNFRVSAGVVFHLGKVLK